MIKKVLVVDDSPIARKIMMSCIPKDREYEVFQAVDGEDGFNKFREIKPHLTFLDITMPVRDGLDTLENIRAIDPTAVVVMCTADIQPQSIARANSLGALTVLRKPPTKEGVAEAISMAEKALSLAGSPDR
jgi:two-component system, chemotaxis family, chemotaxis protein CheY